MAGRMVLLVAQGLQARAKSKKIGGCWIRLGEARLSGVPMDMPTLRDRQSTLILQPLLDQVHCIIQ